MTKLPWERRDFYNSELPPDPMEETEFFPADVENKKEEKKATPPDPSGDDTWSQDLFITEDHWGGQTF